MLRGSLTARRRAALTGLTAVAMLAGLGTEAGAAARPDSPPTAQVAPAGTTAQVAPAGATAAGTAAATAAATDPRAAFTARVVALTNARRKARGCGALAVNATLSRVAQAHTTDMAVHSYVSHYSRTGRSPFDRMRAAGYRYSRAAENVAAGQTTPDTVVAAWMRSPGHRANILNCGLRQIGVGYARNTASRYRHYWTQDFGTPR